MKNPCFKNKLQKSSENNNEVFEKDKIKEPTTELEVNKIKEPMSKQEAKTRRTLLLENLGNNFNFSSIAEMKGFTRAMIDKYLRSNYSNTFPFINFKIEIF